MTKLNLFWPPFTSFNYGMLICKAAAITRTNAYVTAILDGLIKVFKVKYFPLRSQLATVEYIFSENKVIMRKIVDKIKIN